MNPSLTDPPAGARRNDPLVSVIVPVFNTPTHLVSRAVGSITAQTYRNLEILVADDGSHPSLAAHLDLWPGQDSRIAVIHQQNLGVSVARNTALDAATGAYVCFTDADDYLTSTFVADAVLLAQELDLDVVLGGITTMTSPTEDAGSALAAIPHTPPPSPTTDSGREREQTRAHTTSSGFRVLSPAELQHLRAHILSSSPESRFAGREVYATNVVGSLYKAGLVAGIRFPPGIRQSEDRLFNLAAFTKATTVGVVPGATWYVYNRSNPHSATTAVSHLAIDDLVHTMKAFADAGQAAAQHSIAQSAADGVANYFRLATLLLASGPDRSYGVGHMRELLAEGWLMHALRLSQPASPRAWLFRYFAVHRNSRALLYLARLNLQRTGGRVV